jgi:hypothetical protein
MTLSDILSACMIFEVKSASREDSTHHVMVDPSGDVSCTCPGYEYHRKCRHVTPLREFLKIIVQLRWNIGRHGFNGRDILSSDNSRFPPARPMEEEV